MGFLSKLWENWGKGNNAGPTTEPAKKAPTIKKVAKKKTKKKTCLLYTSPSPRDATLSRMPSSA